MVKLLNGRGQLGEALKRVLHYRDAHEDCLIYHTWNHIDKSEQVQETELSKFKFFVDENRDKRIVFTSAIHERFNPYGVAKMKAELYLWERVERSTVIRMPYMVGSGLAQRMKDGQSFGPGKIEVSTFLRMADEIVRSLNDQFERLLVFHGDLISADLLHGAIQFGGA